MLKWTALALASSSSSALALAPTLLGRMRDGAARSPVVVVVGAGLAGLHAAQLLRDAGQPVVVLEAQRRPGGRVRTLRGAAFDDGLHAEAGAARIAPAHRRVFALLDRHRLAGELTPFLPRRAKTVYAAGGVRADSDLELPAARAVRADERGQSAAALLARYAGGDDDAAADRVTWPAWLRARGASDGAIALMTLGADAGHLSARYVLDQIALHRSAGAAAGFYKLRAGMDLLPRAMAAALGDVVRYGAAVTGVARDPAGGLRVAYREDGGAGALVVVPASHVIVAVPAPLAARIDMHALLAPAQRRALAELAYFPATRLLLQARTRAWDGAAAARTDAPAEIWDATWDLAGPRGVLSVTTSPRADHDHDADAGADALTRGGALVAGAFPGVALERGAAVAWADEPWARGAFVAPRPGQMTALLPALVGGTRGDDRIHFAGEHTSPLRGWMEGALASGERAAVGVLTALEQGRARA